MVGEVDMRAVHLKRTVSTQQVADCIRTNGYAVIDQVVAESVMDRIGDELGPYMEKAPFGNSDAQGRLTQRTSSLIARSPTVRELVTNELVVGAVKNILAHATTMHLSLTEAIALSPGSEAQFIHRDELAYDGYPFVKDYEVQVSTLWAMSEYTEEMGATRVVPGSHKAPSDAEFEPADIISVPMERGSILLYSGKIFHGAGENKSNKIRKAVNINYAVGWLRQEENQYLSCPIEIARTLPEDLLRLMGYECCYALGHIGNRMEPLGAALKSYENMRVKTQMYPGSMNKPPQA